MNNTQDWQRVLDEGWYRSAMPSLLKYLTLTVSTYAASNLIISLYRKAVVK
jgi:hypothetical protein